VNISEALTYLEGHVNLEAMLADKRDPPTLDRIRELTSLMGDPQSAYPVIHVTGTNGKGSTTRLATSLLAARGLSVGTYTSPDLQGVNERLAWNGVPISDEDLAGLLSALADLEDLMEARPHRFDLLTAAALRWFADLAVDAAVVEVGLGGTWDATNVVEAEVAVVTNIDLDHQEILGPTRADIARDKAGIVKPGATLVLGETDPELGAIFADTPAGTVWRRDVDFGWSNARLAHGGRVLDLYTPFGTHSDVYLPLHGAHQGDNAAAALAAVESFFGAALTDEVVAEGLRTVRNPGRMEIVSRHPLLILDGAHNPAGARAAAATLEEEFSGYEDRVLVVGMLRGRVPAEMLASLRAEGAKFLVATRAPSPRAVEPEEIVRAARDLGIPAVAEDEVTAALRLAQEAAGPDDLVLVTGTLYVVGAARAALVRDGAR
jgi:dihydrofolate synthase/folylpolyglutamate synthase